MVRPSTVARARALSLRAHSAVDANRGLREARRDALVATRGSHAALRAAVTDLAHQLKGASVPFGEGLAIVQDAVAQCAAVMGADAAVPALMLDCETWSRAAYVG